MCQALEEMKLESWVEGWVEGWIEGWAEGWAEGWTEGWAKGWANVCPQDKAEGHMEGRAEGWTEGEKNARTWALRNLMRNMDMTLGQAMDALSIPAEDRARYAELVGLHEGVCPSSR